MAKVGRPSDYTPELIKEAWDYVENCPDDLPSIEGLCDHINIARKTAYQWAKQTDKQEFSNILETVLRKQGKLLINNGLNGKFNSTIAKLILTKHNYSDKAEVDMTTKGKSMNPGLENLSKEELEQAIARLNEEGSAETPKE